MAGQSRCTAAILSCAISRGEQLDLTVACVATAGRPSCKNDDHITHVNIISIYNGTYYSHSCSDAGVKRGHHFAGFALRWCVPVCLSQSSNNLSVFE